MKGDLLADEERWPACTKACGTTYPKSCEEITQFLSTGCLKQCSAADGAEIRRKMDCSDDSEGKSNDKEKRFRSVVRHGTHTCSCISPFALTCIPGQRRLKPGVRM